MDAWAEDSCEGVHACMQHDVDVLRLEAELEVMDKLVQSVELDQALDYDQDLYTIMEESIADPGHRVKVPRLPLLVPEPEQVGGRRGRHSRNQFSLTLQNRWTWLTVAATVTMTATRCVGSSALLVCVLMCAVVWRCRAATAAAAGGC